MTDDLRFGVTGEVEQTDVADQTAYGVDLRYVFDATSFVEFEAARTDGPTFGQSFSVDGGLIVVDEASTEGTGEAYRLKTEIDFADLGLLTKGTLTGYAERRSEGFSTLDYNIDADERLYGLAVTAEVTERLSYTLADDNFSSDDGDTLAKGLAELTYKATDRITLDFGIRHEDSSETGSPQDTGSRTDLGARITFAGRDDLEYYVFGQSTVAHRGGLGRNDRLDVGAQLGFGRSWRGWWEIVSARGCLGRCRAYGCDLDPGRCQPWLAGGPASGYA